MTLDGYGHLAIAQIIFWTPGLVLATYVALKHGVLRHLDYAFITLLALAGLISPSCTLANEQMTIPNTNVLKTAAICNGVSVSFMIQAILGLLIRVNKGTPGILPAPLKTLKLLHHLFHVIIIAGIILGIVGAVEYIDGINGGSGLGTGLALLKTSYIIFAFCLVVVAITLFTAAARLRLVPRGEKSLIVCGIVCLPFILTRLLYSLICIFAQSQDFNYIQPNIWARSFMAVAQDFIVGIIIIGTGLMTEKACRSNVEKDLSEG